MGKKREDQERGEISREPGAWKAPERKRLPSRPALKTLYLLHIFAETLLGGVKALEDVGDLVKGLVREKQLV